MEKITLPKHWQAPQEVEHSFERKGLKVQLMGYCSQNEQGQQVIGSAGCHLSQPKERAYFELLERMSIIEFEANPSRTYKVFGEKRDYLDEFRGEDLVPQSYDPQKWLYAKSNGIALHTDWEKACQSAKLELIERDCILRSWYGEFAPEKMEIQINLVEDALTSDYEIEVYRFGQNPEVIGLFFIPRDQQAPLVYGFGAAKTFQRAQEKALNESLQRLGFLWGEEIPQEAPEFQPTAFFHQEYYLQPSQLPLIRKWLNGERVLAKPLIRKPTEDKSIHFVDITPIEYEGKFFVAKALSEYCVPMTFGKGHPWLSDEASEDYLLHPLA